MNKKLYNTKYLARSPLYWELGGLMGPGPCLQLISCFVHLEPWKFQKCHWLLGIPWKRLQHVSWCQLCARMAVGNPWQWYQDTEHVMGTETWGGMRSGTAGGKVGIWERCMALYPWLGHETTIVGSSSALPSWCLPRAPSRCGEMGEKVLWSFCCLFVVFLLLVWQKRVKWLSTSNLEPLEGELKES